MGEGSLDGGVGSCSRQGEAGGRDRACSPAKHEWLLSIQIEHISKIQTG